MGYPLDVSIRHSFEHVYGAFGKEAVAMRWGEGEIKEEEQEEMAEGGKMEEGVAVKGQGEGGLVERLVYGWGSFSKKLYSNDTHLASLHACASLLYDVSSHLSSQLLSHILERFVSKRGGEATHELLGKFLKTFPFSSRCVPASLLAWLACPNEPLPIFPSSDSSLPHSPLPSVRLDSLASLSLSLISETAPTHSPLLLETIKNALHPVRNTLCLLKEVWGEIYGERERKEIGEVWRESLGRFVRDVVRGVEGLGVVMKLSGGLRDVVQRRSDDIGAGVDERLVKEISLDFGWDGALYYHLFGSGDSKHPEYSKFAPLFQTSHFSKLVTRHIRSAPSPSDPSPLLLALQEGSCGENDSEKEGLREVEWRLCVLRLMYRLFVQTNMESHYYKQDPKTLPQLSHATFRRDLDPTDLPALFRTLIQNLFPFFNSLDHLLHKLGESLSSYSPSSSSFTPLLEEVGLLLVVFDGRQGLFSCWDNDFIDRHATVELWRCFSLSVHQLFSSVISAPSSTHLPPLLLRSEPANGLIGWFVGQEECKKLVSSFFFFFNTLNAEVLKSVGGVEGEKGEVVTVRKGYQKACGKVGLFKCSSLGSLYDRFTSASDSLFSSSSSFSLGGGVVGKEEEFVNPLAVAVRGKVAGDLFSSILDALSSLSSLNDNEDFVLALRQREESMTEGEVENGLEGEIATMMEIFHSLSRLCEFVEGQVTSLTSPPPPPTVATATEGDDDGDQEMEDIDAPASSPPPVARSPSSSSKDSMTKDNFQFHPQIVSVVDDVLSLRHELDVRSSLLRALVIGDQEEKEGDNNDDAMDGVVVVKDPESSQSFHFSAKLVRDVVSRYLSASVGKMASRPPTDFVAYQRLFWRCSSLVEVGEKEEKRRMGELMILLTSFHRRLWDIPFPSVLALLKDAQENFSFKPKPREEALAATTPATTDLDTEIHRGSGVLYCASRTKFAFSVIQNDLSGGCDIPIESVTPKITQLRKFIVQMADMRREREGEDRVGKEGLPDWSDWVTLLFKVCQLVEVKELGLEGEVGEKVLGLCLDFLTFLEMGDKEEKETEKEWDLSGCHLDQSGQKLLQKALSILSSTLSSLPLPSSVPFTTSLPPYRSSLAEGLVLVGLLRVRLLLPHSGVDPRMKHTTRRKLLEGAAEGVREEVRMREVMGKREVGAPVELLVQRSGELGRLEEEIGKLKWKEIRRGQEEGKKNDYEAVVRVMNHCASSVVNEGKVCGLFSRLLSASSDRLSQIAEEEVFLPFFLSFLSFSHFFFFFFSDSLAKTYLSCPR